MSDFFALLVSALVQLVLFALIPFVWWLFTRPGVGFFQWIGLKKPIFAGPRLELAAVVLAAVAGYLAGMYLILRFLLGDVETAAGQFAGKGLSAVPGILVYALIQTSLSEELFFRGFLCKRLSARFGSLTGNLIQALLFGLCHGIPFGLATGNWLVCLLLTLLPGGIGFLQGWLNEQKSGGSILPSWLLHGLMNLLSALSSI